MNADPENHGLRGPEPGPAAPGRLHDGVGARPEDRRIKDFSAANREAREGIDPETGEKVELLTKKQYLEKMRKELREF